MHCSCFITIPLKPVFLVIIFVSLLDVHAQPLNRVYISFGSGYRKHQEFALTVHAFNHFSFAWNIGDTHIPTGPVYYPGTGFLSFGKRLKNEYQSQSFFLGFTTQRFKPVNYSVMLGPSFNQSLEYTNIVVHENEYTYGEWVTKTNVRDTAVGLVVRADLAISLSENVGLNFSIQQNFNSIRNDCNVLIGLNLGITEDLLEW